MGSLTFLVPLHLKHNVPNSTHHLLSPTTSDCCTQEPPPSHLPKLIAVGCAFSISYCQCLLPEDRYPPLHFCFYCSPLDLVYNLITCNNHITGIQIWSPFSHLGHCTHSAKTLYHFAEQRPPRLPNSIIVLPQPTFANWLPELPNMSLGLVTLAYAKFIWVFTHNFVEHRILLLIF